MVWYATLEEVKSALDVAATSRSDAQILRAIESASRKVERDLHRPTIAPTLDTRYFAYPGGRNRLRLEEDTLISTSLITTDGVTVAPTTGYLLGPANRNGRPYSYVDVQEGTTWAYASDDWGRRSVVITGLFGYSDDSVDVGATSGTFAIDDTLVNLVSPLVGVGSVLRVNDERVITTARNMTDTGLTLDANLLANNSDSLLHADGATLYVGEVLLVGSEQLLVTDAAGSDFVVKRAWSGTTLAAHTAGDAIYSNRAFTVERGALGTVPAVHADGSVWSVWVVPGPVKTQTIAEVLNQFEQETSAYARTVGSGESARNATGQGIEAVRYDTFSVMGRKGRQA